MKFNVFKLRNCVKVFILALALGNGYNTHAQTNEQLSLKEAVEIAVKNNLDVKQSDFDMQRAEVRWKQSKANLFPYLEGFANHGTQQGRNIDPYTNAYINQNINVADYGLSAGVTLFNGLSINRGIKRDALSYEASKQELQQNKDNLTLNVILAYLQVLNNTDLVDQSTKQAELSKKQVERLDILNREGAIAPSELYDLKGQFAADELAIVNNQNALDAAKLTLSQLMNVPYSNIGAVERLNLDQFALEYGSSPEQIYQLALEQLALVKAARLRTESSEKAVQALRGRLFPTLSLNGNLTTRFSSAAMQDQYINTTNEVTKSYVEINGQPTFVYGPRDNFQTSKIAYGNQLQDNLFTSVSLGLRIPIFNNLLVRSQVRIAKIDQKNFEFIEQTTRTQLKQNIEQAYFNMTAAQKRYKTILEQVSAFSESFRAAEEKFNAGASNSVDYLTAKNNLDRANINLIIARYDFVLRTKVLDYYQSRPLW